MAGVLEYALSLKTAGFDNPLRSSEAGLKRFDTAAGNSSTSLSSIAAGAAGASAVFAGFALVTASALSNLQAYAEYDGLVRGLKTLEGSAEDTANRLKVLREVAKAPGLGFEEAVRGDIRLRSVGISADLSGKALKAFGNAIATVGGGKSDLDGVILALGQIQSKGSIAAEEINQINERIPQVRAAMKAAFGTADAEALGKAGLTTTQFIEQLVAELGKLPQVTGGAQNALDNYDDSWKQLKTSANEFAVGLSGSWLNSVSGVFNQASRDLKSLQSLFGLTTPGLEGPEGTTEKLRNLKALREVKVEAAKQASARQIALEKANAEFSQQKSQERAEFEKQRDTDRLANVKRNLEQIRSLGEQFAKASLSDEAFLQQKIAQLKKGPTSKADIAKLPNGSDQQLAAVKNVTELAQAEKQLADLKSSGAAADAAKKKTAESATEAKYKELSAQQQASALFNQENEILKARVTGNEKLVNQLERQAKVEALKLSLQIQQGLSEKDAAEAAEKRIALEDRANGSRRRGVLDAAASAVARQERRSAADVKKDKPESNTDRLALADFARRTKTKPLTPDAAAAQLARGSAAADPGKDRRAERREQKQNAADPLLAAVRDIQKRFETLATA
jgi:tape measure domain-containing protein